MIHKFHVPFKPPSPLPRDLIRRAKRKKEGTALLTPNIERGTPNVEHRRANELNESETGGLLRSVARNSFRGSRQRRDAIIDSCGQYSLILRILEGGQRYCLPCPPDSWMSVLSRSRHSIAEAIAC